MKTRIILIFGLLLFAGACYSQTTFARAVGGTGQDCGYGHSAYAMALEEGLKTKFFGHSDELMAELRELASRSPNMPDTTDPSLRKSQSSDNTIKPNDFSLETYPTPFNSSISIRIFLPEEAPLSIVVYNIRGEIIRKLHSGNCQQGANYFLWDSYDEKGNSVSAGIYLISAKYLNNAKVEKAILIK